MSCWIYIHGTQQISSSVLSTTVSNLWSSTRQNFRSLASRQNCPNRGACLVLPREIFSCFDSSFTFCFGLWGWAQRDGEASLSLSFLSWRSVVSRLISLPFTWLGGWFLSTVGNSSIGASIFAVELESFCFFLVQALIQIHFLQVS